MICETWIYNPRAKKSGVRPTKDVLVCAIEVVELKLWWFSYHLRNSLKIASCLEVSYEVRPEVDNCKEVVRTTITNQGGRPCKA